MRRPSFEQLRTFPTITSFKNGRNTIYRNLTNVRHAPSPGAEFKIVSNGVKYDFLAKISIFIQNFDFYLKFKF